VGNIVTCSNAFATCTDSNKCACWQNFTACVPFTGCDGVNSTLRKNCCESQFFCSDLAHSCNQTTEDSISIPDLDDLFNRFSNDFIALWNKDLQNVNITIIDCIHVTQGNDVQFTVHASFDETENTAAEVGQHIIDQFSLTIGINEDHISGHLSESTRKRQTGYGTYQITATGAGNGSSMISVFILPIILLNGLLYLLFN